VRQRYLWLLSLFCLWPELILAQVEEPLCMSKVKNEEDINICQYATAKYLELQVKETEEKILLRFSGAQLTRFQEAQANWRLMMNLDCEIQSYFYEGAGIYTAIQSQCLQGHYRTRLETLRRYLCPEHQYLNGCSTVPAQQNPHLDRKTP
jgi:uncharacterized protein YecT (DUF1311 family)